MPHRLEKRTIQPTAPDKTVRGLLALPLAQVLPLAAGSWSGGYGRTGDYVFIAAVQGSHTVSAHGQYALLDPGQAFLLDSPGDWSLQGVSDGLCMTVLLQGELVPRLLEDRLSGGSALFPQGGAVIREAVSSLSILEDEQGQAAGTAASSLAWSMLLRLRALPQEPRSDLGSVLVEGALAIIQEELPFLEGVEDLAARLEVSAAHLSRAFSKKVGVPPGKYITRMRVSYAKLLLQDPDAAITYVAGAAGFANANYFSKVFRRETGLSPSEYLESIPRQAVRRPHMMAYDQGL